MKKAQQLMVQIFGLVILITFILHAETESDHIIGTWLTEKKEATIKIIKTGEIFSGRIAWMRNPNDKETGKPKLDVKNPDKTKRKQPIVGSIILSNLTFKDGEYRNGRIYNSRTGKSYDCVLWLENNNTLKLKVTLGFLSRTITWTRVKKK